MWSTLSKEIIVIATGLFVALTSYLLVKMGIIITSIAWLICAAYLLSVACIYLYRRIKYGKFTKTNLSFEIDHNLELLFSFWEGIGVSSTEPMTVAQAFNNAQRVVSEDPSAETIHAMRKDYYLTEAPNWHRKTFDSPTSLSVLPEREQQGVRQFYDKLSAITSTYENLRTSKGTTIIGELENKLKVIITEVLEQGNPLKNT